MFYVPSYERGFLLQHLLRALGLASVQQPGLGYEYVRCRVGDDDSTVSIHQLIACLELEPPLLRNPFLADRSERVRSKRAGISSGTRPFSELVRASQLYDVESRTPVIHSASPRVSRSRQSRRRADGYRLLSVRTRSFRRRTIRRCECDNSQNRRSLERGRGLTLPRRQRPRDTAPASLRAVGGRRRFPPRRWLPSR